LDKLWNLTQTQQFFGELPKSCRHQIMIASGNGYMNQAHQPNI